MNHVGSNGCYWSSSFKSVYPSCAYNLYFDLDYVTPQNSFSRCDGQPVRPVLRMAK